MNSFIASSTGRIAAQIHNVGASFDPEVLSLPGGSIIAVLLWLYTSTRLSFKRSAPSIRSVIEPVVPAACVGCTGHP